MDDDAAMAQPHIHIISVCARPVEVQESDSSSTMCQKIEAQDDSRDTARGLCSDGRKLGRCLLALGFCKVTTWLPHSSTKQHFLDKLLEIVRMKDEYIILYILGIGVEGSADIPMGSLQAEPEPADSKALQQAGIWYDYITPREVLQNLSQNLSRETKRIPIVLDSCFSVGWLQAAEGAALEFNLEKFAIQAASAELTERGSLWPAWLEAQRRSGSLVVRSRLGTKWNNSLAPRFWVPNSAVLDRANSIELGAFRFYLVGERFPGWHGGTWTLWWPLLLSLLSLLSLLLQSLLSSSLLILLFFLGASFVSNGPRDMLRHAGIPIPIESLSQIFERLFFPTRSRLPGRPRLTGKLAHRVKNCKDIDAMGEGRDLDSEASSEYGTSLSSGTASTDSTTCPSSDLSEAPPLPPILEDALKGLCCHRSELAERIRRHLEEYWRFANNSFVKICRHPQEESVPQHVATNESKLAEIERQFEEMRKAETPPMHGQDKVLYCNI